MVVSHFRAFWGYDNSPASIAHTTQWYWSGLPEPIDIILSFGQQYKRNFSKQFLATNLQVPMTTSEAIAVQYRAHDRQFGDNP